MATRVGRPGFLFGIAFAAAFFANFSLAEALLGEVVGISDGVRLSQDFRLGDRQDGL